MTYVQIVGTAIVSQIAILKAVFCVALDVRNHRIQLKQSIPPHTMSLPTSSLTSIPTSYATVSIGTPAQPLSHKLDAIVAAGFQGIELGFPDLLSFASQFHGHEIGNQDFPALCEAAKEVKQMCATRSLKVVMMQPFANFEGWAPGSKEREDAFQRAEGWMGIMEAVGCDMLQVRSELFGLMLCWFADEVALGTGWFLGLA